MYVYLVENYSAFGAVMFYFITDVYNIGIQDMGNTSIYISCNLSHITQKNISTPRYGIDDGFLSCAQTMNVLLVQRNWF